ncbi:MULTISPECIES: DsrH/TusB family sulfur metabolism protein [unclassified Alteromonas]|uniref:DsrH/TusB family sulfur metabolism protein n=1 Tax=unclassified Alteromonas TaxID=2614992 RepID=UPI000509EBC7|nr:MULTISPECIES: DsrH/TusB family sulfur metabolism protein [unclassified Alteromonas]
MIINITSTQLSDSNKALINAVFDANLDAVLITDHEAASNTGVKKDQATDSAPIIVFSGDGVFAQSSTAALLAKRKALSNEAEASPSKTMLFAVKEDLALRGACVVNNVSIINYQEFAELASRHQQWVTL